MITIEQVIEQCAQAAEVAQGLNGSRDGKVLAAIRALTKQYEGYRVVPPDSAIYKQIVDNYAREAK